MYRSSSAATRSKEGGIPHGAPLSVLLSRHSFSLPPHDTSTVATQHVLPAMLSHSTLWYKCNLCAQYSMYYMVQYAMVAPVYQTTAGHGIPSECFVEHWPTHRQHILGHPTHLLSFLCRYVITDDRGYLCTREKEDPMTGCCTSGDQYSCET